MNKKEFSSQGEGNFHEQLTTFADGEVGQAIKARIEVGIACEEIFPDDIGGICPNLAVVGINWQAGRQIRDTVFVCNGKGTVPATLLRIKSDLIKSGFAPNISINGHGRP